LAKRSVLPAASAGLVARRERGVRLADVVENSLGCGKLGFCIVVVSELAQGNAELAPQQDLPSRVRGDGLVKGQPVLKDLEGIFVASHPHQGGAVVLGCVHGGGV
jgi:hypothetical protein